MATKFTKRYLLLDANALIHRGYHAIPFLTTSAGLPTNAVYGFTSIFLKAVQTVSPTHIAAAFDLAGPTFRHEQYEDYKGTRSETPDDLIPQFDLVKKLLQAMGIPVLTAEGFEADDVLGTLAHELYQKEPQAQIIIATGDRDSFQLVNDRVSVCTLKKGVSDLVLITPEGVKEQFGVWPEQVVDVKALQGDASDNIPGVPGIGAKTATTLLEQFGSLKDIYAAVKSGKTEPMKSRTVELLQKGEELAWMSQTLARIRTDVPITLDIPIFEFTPDENAATLAVMQEFEFQSLVRKLPPVWRSQSQQEQSYEAPATQAKPIKPRIEIDSNAIAIQIENNLTEVKWLELIEKLETDKVLALKDTDDELIAVTNKLWSKIQWTEIADFFERLQKASVTVVGYDVKTIWRQLINRKIQNQIVIQDVLLLAYCLQPGQKDLSLSFIARQYGQYMLTDSANELEQAQVIIGLWPILQQSVTQQELVSVYTDLELPIVPILAEMEVAGVGIDTVALKSLSNRAKVIIEEVTGNIFRLAGHEFLISSPKQLGEVLFEELGLVPPVQKKNKSGGYSTAADVLEKIVDQHEIVKEILRYREMTKLQSTYLEALPKVVASDGRLHSTFNQTIAATGRLSSSEPNLQNIPVRGEGLGHELRAVFVPAYGFELLSVDYSQIELRIVAHLASDEAMIKVFREGRDIHTETAMRIFHVAENAVTADMRRDAKMVNFGILYGLSGFGLSDRLESVDISTAKSFIEKYMAGYPKVAAYIEQVKMEVRETHEVRNPLGRVRRFPEMASSMYQVKQAAERAAVNFPIQSLEADIMKLAMVAVQAEIEKTGGQDKPRLVLQVHDELLFEVPVGTAEKWAKKFQPMLESVMELQVPLETQAKSGKSWGELNVIK